MCNTNKEWIKLCYSTADVIVTPTEYSRRLLLSYGIKKPIEVVSNGIDLEYYSNGGEAGRVRFRAKYGYEDGDKVVMSVGLPIGRKGVDGFVELAARLPDYKFIWFGDTDMRLVPRRIRRAVSTKLPNLTFAGYADREALKDAYAGADLFLFLSHEETEGIALLEALAMRIPVLVRDIPVYLDWLVDGVQVYKARDTEEFARKTGLMLRGELPLLTGAAYEAARERSLKNVGVKLSNVWRHSVDMGSSEVVGKDMVKIFHTNTSKA